MGRMLFARTSQRSGTVVTAALGALLATAMLFTPVSPVPRQVQGAAPGLTRLVTLSTSSLTPATRWTVLAVRRTTLTVYTAHATVLTRLSNPNRYGEPLVLLGLGHMPGWWYAQLPTRPNGAKGWVRSSDVTPAVTPYEIHIYRAAHRLDVIAGRRLVYRTAIAVGAAAAPTPSGRYYVTMLLRPANPYGPYGPWAFGLSAFSNVFTQFANGTGEIGLHGTNTPWLLGQNISHGCIRVSNTAITRIVHTVPVGAPVFIHA